MCASALLINRFIDDPRCLDASLRRKNSLLSMTMVVDLASSPVFFQVDRLHLNEVHVFKSIGDGLGYVPPIQSRAAQIIVERGR